MTLFVLEALQDVSDLLQNPNIITRTVDRREAVRSSQIEGTSSDMDDLLTYEVTGSDDGMPIDVRVTKNYVSALEYGLEKVRDNGASALDGNLTKKLHQILMSDTDYSGIPGEYREIQNWIGGGGRIYNARYVPPPPNRVQECMKDLETLLSYMPEEEDQKYLSIITRMAIVHAQFESIHPFVDGNGRVGRILLPLMLAAEGYPPVYLAGYLKDNQEDYYDGLAGVQLKGQWEHWLKFFSLGVEAAAHESIKTGAALVRLQKKWEDEVATLGLRSHSVLYRFPALLIGSPVLTAHSVKDTLGISFPSASKGLQHFEKMGILRLKKKHRRNRVFIAAEVIDILNSPA